MAVETVAETDPATWGRIQWAAFGVGFEAGCFRGYEACRRAVDAHDEAMWAAAVRNVQATARRPSYAALAQRRCEPDRAKRARAHERRLGLAS